MMKMTTRGLVSALAVSLAAGTALAQQDYGAWGQRGQQQWEQDRFTTGGFERGEQRWRTTTNVPQLRGVELTLAQLGEETDTFVRVEDGRIVSASIDGQPVSREQVQVRGDRIRVLDDGGETAAIFRIPPVAHALGMQERMWQERQFGRQMGRPFDGRQAQRFGPGGPGQRLLGTPELPVADMQTGAVGILMLEAQPHHLRGTDYNSGVKIDAIHEGMPAHRAGLRRNDIIVAVDGRENVTPERLKNFLRQVPTGERISFTFIRDGEERDVNVRTATPMAANINWDYMVTGLDDRQLRQEQMRLERQRQILGFQEGRLTGVGLSRADEAALADLEEYGRGLEVSHVTRGTILHEAGLQRGDVIVGADGQSDLSRDDLKNIFENKEPGDTVRLRVLRDGSLHTVNVRMGRAGR
jgi:hypothetical protein